MKVLMVDDDRYEIQALVDILAVRHPKDEFESTFNLREARNQIWSKKYDAIVLDIIMPPNDEIVPRTSHEAGLISGLRLMDMIRRDRKCPNNRTPITLLTASMSDEHPRLKLARRELGKNFVQKPIHPDLLYDVIMKSVKKAPVAVPRIRRRKTQ